MIQPGAPPVLGAMIVAAITSAQLVASRALRDGYFLAHFPATDLPKIVIASAILSLVVVLTSTHLLRRVAPGNSVPWLFAASAILFALEAALSTTLPRVTAVIIYLHVLSLGLLVASGYWSVLSERFDPHSAKRFIGRIGGGATLGGALGGLGAWWGASVLEATWLLLALAVLNFAGAVGVHQLGKGSAPPPRSSEEPRSALPILRDTPYLRHLALLVGLAAFTQACYDYVLKATVASNYSDGGDLVSFFAIFYMSLNVCTFIAQNLLTRQLLERYGLTATVASLPGGGILLGAVAMIFPGLGSAALMRGGVGVLENSTFRSGYELLYTPVLPEKKRPTKSIIDVGGEMLGATAGGALIFIVLILIPGVATTTLVLAGMAAGIVGVAVTRKVRQGYVDSLADSLEADNIDLEGAAFPNHREILPAAVVTALQSQARREARKQIQADSSPPIDRHALLQDVQARAARLRAARQEGAELPQALAGDSGGDKGLAAVQALRTGEPGAVKRALKANRPLPEELVPFTMDLLANDACAEYAVSALRDVAPRHCGALLDLALAPDTGPAAMQRICSIFAANANQRSANALLDLLEKEAEDTNLYAVDALLALHRASPQLDIPRRRVFSLVERQARATQQRWRSLKAVDLRVDDTPPLDSPEGQRIVEDFTYISALLLTVLDPQPAGLALRALANPTPAQRGTGLEYLQNVLPPRLLEVLQPLLEDPALALGDVRPRKQVVAQAEARQTPGLAQLKRRVDEARRDAGPVEAGT